MRIVLTGGPGAGKTAVLETARLLFSGVVVLPESASILFTGGFPRHRSDPARRAVQRAIFHVQCELEQLHREERPEAVLLCDRGTIDGLAYWPGDAESWWEELATTPEAQYGRYDAVIHLRVPGVENGYRKNHTRIESASEAATIDARIADAWKGHPHRIEIASTLDFVHKVQATLQAIRKIVPEAWEFSD